MELVRLRAPGLMIDGEMQADTAVVPQIIDETYPFSTLKGGANVLIFPNLESGNIAYKLLHRIGGAELIGPLLAGLSKPVHVLQRGSEVNDIVNVAAVAVVDAQESGKPYRTLSTVTARLSSGAGGLATGLLEQGRYKTQRQNTLRIDVRMPGFILTSDS